MTPKQRIEGVAAAALSFIVGLRQDGQQYPTITEIAAHCGCARMDAYAAVELLIERGKLKRLNSRTRRSIRLIEDDYPRPWLHPSNMRYRE